MSDLTPDLLARFWAKVLVSAPTDCWIWTGARSRDNGRVRGAFTINGRRIRPSRFSAILAHGEPKPFQHALHSCDEPLCCNPDHLRWGSHQENMNDRDARGRHGSANQTHCRRGHPQTPDNLEASRDGRRRCKVCRNARARSYASKRRSLND